MQPVFPLQIIVKMLIVHIKQKKRASYKSMHAELTRVSISVFINFTLLHYYAATRF